MMSRTRAAERRRTIRTEMREWEMRARASLPPLLLGLTVAASAGSALLALPTVFGRAEPPVEVGGPHEP